MEDRGDADLGNKLRGLREVAKLTQAEAAAAIGISRGHVSAIETGKRPVGRRTLVAMADLYGTSLDFIATKLGEVRGAEVRNDLEAVVLMLVRELPKDETEAWVKLMMTRLKGSLHTS